MLAQSRQGREAACRIPSDRNSIANHEGSALSERTNMRHLSILLVAAATLVGCVTEASGPRFTAQAPLIAGQARIYVLCDKVLYLAQGPGIGKPEVAIDRRVIGYLENGGFLTADVPAGMHTVSVGTGEAETARGFIVAPGGEDQRLGLRWDEMIVNRRRRDAGGKILALVGVEHREALEERDRVGLVAGLGSAGTFAVGDEAIGIDDGGAVLTLAHMRADFERLAASFAAAAVTRQGGDVHPERGKRRTAPGAQRLERGPTPAPGSALGAARG
jgi:hypothetical protein